MKQVCGGLVRWAVAGKWEVGGSGGGWVVGSVWEVGGR